MLSVISYPVFALSVVLSLVLSISLFPIGWFEFRPEWLGLMVFYWTFRAPAQQCLMVFLLLGINQMLVHFIKQMLGGEDAGFSFLWPALTSALVWPLVCVLLDNLNRKLG